MDLWDQVDERTWYVSLPGMDVETFLSGETESLFIREEKGTFWLDNPNGPGQSPCKTLAEAKKAGDEMVEDMYERQPAAIARAARLPEGWVFKWNEHELHYFAKADAAEGEGPEIVRNGADDWAVVENEEEIVSSQSSPAVALAEFESRRSFAPTI